jgi:[acyl-carrier-protein] S-malonyltransferase
MAVAAQSFGQLLEGAAFSNARFPVLCNAEPSPTTDAEIIRERLTRQITSPVRWTETMAQIVSGGPTTIIECGPGAVLTGLAKRVDGATAVAIENAGLEAVIEEVL